VQGVGHFHCDMSLTFAVLCTAALRQETLSTYLDKAVAILAELEARKNVRARERERERARAR